MSPAITKGQILEFMQIAIGNTPNDLGVGGSTGDWVSLTKFDRLLAVAIRSAPSSTGDKMKFTIQQAKDTTGTSAKGLNVKKVWSKTDTAKLRATAVWTESTGTLGGTGTTGSTFAGVGTKKAAMYAFDIGADELDVDNGFKFVRINIADPGATGAAGIAGAGKGVTFYLVYNAKMPNKPANAQSVIA